VKAADYKWYDTMFARFNTFFREGVAYETMNAWDSFNFQGATNPRINEFIEM
jgi:hypothetical protein